MLYLFRKYYQAHLWVRTQESTRINHTHPMTIPFFIDGNTIDFSTIAPKTTSTNTSETSTSENFTHYSQPTMQRYITDNNFCQYSLDIIANH